MLYVFFARTTDCPQVSSQMEKKTKVTMKRRTYFDEDDPDDNDDDLM